MRAVPSPAPCHASVAPLTQDSARAPSKDLRSIQRAATERETLSELSLKPYVHPSPSRPRDNPRISQTAQGLGEGMLHAPAGRAAPQRRVFS